MKLRKGLLTALLHILHPDLGLALAFQTLDRANCWARADTAPSHSIYTASPMEDGNTGLKYLPIRWTKKKWVRVLVGQIKKLVELWLVIGCRVAVPRSHWSAVPTPLFDNISHFLYLSNPPSGNLLPILPQHLHTLATTWPSSQHSTRVLMLMDIWS